MVNHARIWLKLLCRYIFQDKYFNDRNGQNQEIIKGMSLPLTWEFKEANLLY